MALTCQATWPRKRLKRIRGKLDNKTFWRSDFPLQGMTTLKNPSKLALGIRKGGREGMRPPCPGAPAPSPSQPEVVTQTGFAEIEI